MTQQLEIVFGELGIAQYLPAFIDQGFDTWDTILDITESDLDALGVKLGHRRKLQRRIANARGLAPESSLITSTQPSIEDVKHDGIKSDAFKSEARGLPTPGVVAKRKYRRHPKPDENAPERPPSAYVLFSNKMREELKGRNLTFTEIAKLVGEHWQNLAPSDKEPFESQVQVSKDRYNQDLAEYKKTADYKKYTQYLQDFKAKYAHQSQEKDASKRVKLSGSGNLSQNESSSGTPNRTSRSRSGSGSEDLGDYDYSKERRQRKGSSSSTAEAHQTMTPFTHHASLGDSVNSPTSQSLDQRSIHQSPATSRTHERAWSEEQRHLPLLSNMLEQRSILNDDIPSADADCFPFPKSSQKLNSPGPTPALVGGEMRPRVLLETQHSSASTSSGSSLGCPRTPIEGSLPIHALLSAKPEPPYDSLLMYQSTNPVAAEANLSILPVNGASKPYVNGFRVNGTLPLTSVSRAPTNDQLGQSSKGQLLSFDGMSALLKAGEIVGRQTQ